MSSSNETSPTRDILDDRLLTFDCYEFSRGVKSGRPKSRRWVFAEKCLCTNDADKICNPTQFYALVFTETSDTEETKRKQETSLRNPHLPADL